MEGQLTEAEKKARSRVLLELDQRQRKAFLEQFIGENVEVLLEEETEADGQILLDQDIPENIFLCL